ncbi:MAG TPA: NUDIX domain-containing protein [Kofleriaceae bacterium]|nr:NUDIX domain-containing protein [Kofleriaceae bacterium]
MTLDALRTALQHTSPGNGPVTGDPLRASVCAIVAGPEPAPSLCLIRRARWQSDPWSEHIALPGGRRSGDEAAPATARRELREEIGVDVPEAALVALPQLRVRLAGRERLMLIDPFVYLAGAALPPLAPGPEIDLAFWVPLAALWDLGNATCHVLHDGETLVYPALRTPHGVIFGITLRVLTLLSDQLGVPLPMIEEIPQLRRADR